jgi:hypothetical protein
MYFYTSFCERYYATGTRITVLSKTSDMAKMTSWHVLCRLGWCSIILFHRIFHKFGIMGSRSFFKRKLSLHAVRPYHKKFTSFFWNGKIIYTFASALVLYLLSILYNSCVKTPISPMIPDLWSTYRGKSAKWSNTRFNIFIAVNVKITVFWGMVPCSLVERHWHIRGTSRGTSIFRTLKMRTEMSVPFYWIMLCHRPEESNVISKKKT